MRVINFRNVRGPRESPRTYFLDIIKHIDGMNFAKLSCLTFFSLSLVSSVSEQTASVFIKESWSKSAIICMCCLNYPMHYLIFNIVDFKGLNGICFLPKWQKCRCYFDVKTHGLIGGEMVLVWNMLNNDCGGYMGGRGCSVFISPLPPYIMNKVITFLLCPYYTFPWGCTVITTFK